MLDTHILKFLSEARGRSKTTIRSEISRLRRNFQRSTSNAIAQIYAQQYGLSVRKFLSREDKLTIPPVDYQPRTPVLKMKRGKSKERIKNIFGLETTEEFVKKHVDEINRAYAKKYYTCVFVLSRKMFENLIIDILRRRFPAEPELYYDKERHRNHDFSVVLNNLFNNRNDFIADKKDAIERLHGKLKPFKDDANKKAHSLYHIVESAKEVDDWNLDTINALFKTIMKGL